MIQILLEKRSLTISGDHRPGPCRQLGGPSRWLTVARVGGPRGFHDWLQRFIPCARRLEPYFAVGREAAFGPAKYYKTRAHSGALRAGRGAVAT